MNQFLNDFNMSRQHLRTNEHPQQSWIEKGNYDNVVKLNKPIFIY